MMLLALFAVLFVSAFAQDPQPRQIGVKEGVQNVTVIEQDNAGLLWIGTADGLYSYDGANFRRYGEAEGLPDAAIGFLLPTKAALWVGTIKGLSRKEGDRFTKVFTLELPSGWMFADAADRLYFLAPYLHIFTNSKLLDFPAIRFDGPVALSPQGRVWYPCGTEVCQIDRPALELLQTGHRKSNLPVRRLGANLGLPPLPWNSVVEDKDGTIWTSSSHQKAFWRAAAGKRFERIPVPNEINKIRLDGRGNAILLGIGWVGLPLGKATKFYLSPGPFFLQTVFIDREGTVWMGDSSAGIWRWRQNSGIEVIAQKPGVAKQVTFQTTRLLDGTLLASGYSGILRISADPAGLVPFAPARKDATSFSVAADLDGGALAGLEGVGLLRLGSDGRQSDSINDQDGKSIPAIRVIRVDRKGVAWISTPSSFYRLARGSKTAERVEIVPGKADYRDIAFARNGDKWVAFEKGLAQLHAGKWRVFTTKDGLKSNYLRCVAEDGEGNLWIGYRMPIGFAKLTGEAGKWEVRQFDGGEGIGSNSTFFLKVDSRGWIWRGTNDGVHISKSGSTEPGDWLQLTTEDGLPNNDAAQFSFFEDADGSVWFGTNGGLTHVRPEAVERAFQSRIGLAIASAHVEGALLSATSRPIAFSHRDRVQYRYRVTPSSSEWSWQWTEKLSIATIPYGAQTLEVQARRPGAMWSESATHSVFRALPWWRTAPAFVAYACILAGLFLWRFWRQREFEQEKSLFMEVAELPFDAQRLRLAQARPRVAKRVRLLLAARPERADEGAPGILLNGRYRIEGRVAQGGMATIYRARDERLSNRPTAIKILRPDIGDAAWLARRFEQERQALGRIQHPGVISVIDIGETPQGLAFLALEFVDGPTLRQLLQSGPLDLLRAAGFLRQAAEALDAAHHMGVTHRDLKPENLMVRFAGTREERLVIVDFGIAVVRGTGDSTLVLSHAAGSLHYMAPEQAQGRVTPACDLYALGLIVFEMITGERAIPLGLGSDGDLPGKTASYLHGRANTEAIDLLVSALRFDPAGRPAATGEWGRDLAALLEQPLA